ncbi:uncharacterized protein ACIBXB_015763 [Morphnus guianensis]
MKGLLVRWKPLRVELRCRGKPGSCDKNLAHHRHKGKSRNVYRSGLGCIWRVLNQEMTSCIKASLDGESLPLAEAKEHLRAELKMVSGEVATSKKELEHLAAEPRGFSSPGR